MQAILLLTKNVLIRFEERGIILGDVSKVIMQGEIIEQCPDDFPYPSFLLLGLSISGMYLHACVASSGENIRVITACYPDLNECEPDFKTRTAIK